MCKVTISVYEFLKEFPDETVAREYLENRRWENGIICPHCNSNSVTRQRDPQYLRCRTCRKVFTVRTGTVMERSHIPLDKWLYTMYLLATARKGISSLQLSKELGITQKSSWFMLQRLREACSQEGKAPFGGIVEVDETYIGGKEKNKHGDKKLHAGRGAVGKQAVIGIRERSTGKVTAKPISNTSAQTLNSFVIDNAKKNATICTDKHRGYGNLSALGFNHKTVNHSAREYVNGMAHTNGIESVWALLKRGHYGTFHHFSVKHLRRYVDEFSFRLNGGNVSRHTLERIASLCNMTIGKRLTYQRLIT